MQVTQPRILFIDAYDSFSNNIISLLETTLSCSVRTVKIDDHILISSDELLREELSHYDAVVCGPGPGSPENTDDVGIFRKIWRLSAEDLLPVLGICLGFQSLCLEFGAGVCRLKGPQHGIVRRVTHVGEVDNMGEGTIFEGVGKLNATHYQSLCADIGQDAIPSASWDTSKWDRPKNCADLVPLAYAESDLSIPNISGIKDERVLVAVRHVSKPFWALQYHPESICTEAESHKVIKNWFLQSQEWNHQFRKTTLKFEEPVHGSQAVRKSLLSQSPQPLPFVNHEPAEETVCFWEVMDLPSHITVVDLADEFCDGPKRMILESTNTHEVVQGTADVRGRFSILALDLQDPLTIEYRVGADSITHRGPAGKAQTFPLHGATPWSFVAQYMESVRARKGPEESPFWGGLMGFTTYELGLESIDVKSTKAKQGSRPDMCLAWVRQSLVVDHRKKQIYIQQLGSSNSSKAVRAEVKTLRIKLENFLTARSPPSPSGSYSSDFDGSNINTPLSTPSLSTSTSHTNLQHYLSPTSHPKLLTRPVYPATKITKPTDNSYESKVINCQAHISAGNSYELCLTDQTSVTRSISTVPRIPSSWSLYLSLRTRQPAPFASYISLGGATLVSSSPERFLTWTHQNHCSLRPMKGTVKKSATVDTLAKATALLDVPKEKAENLMIVDLVRHDLHGICGSGNVGVPRLCVVEEYKSVYTMISVVEGQIPDPTDLKPTTACDCTATAPRNEKSQRHTGLDVLAASLPPGSMTGAPKKRSCEILQGIEEQERGMYSGVVGYVDVRGRGDWSVTIRSLFKWDDEDEDVAVDAGGVEGQTQMRETWHIGAGGAVTTLSTAVGEREEMSTKLAGTLGLFL